MLTIGQLAAYAGVTVRAVRHYHQIGILPEPERDASGYRRYGATAVVSLIKIRTLANAGVPLSQIGQMLEADASTFADAIQRIDTTCSTQSTRWIPRADARSSGDFWLSPRCPYSSTSEIGASQRMCTPGRTRVCRVGPKYLR